MKKFDQFGRRLTDAHAPINPEMGPGRRQDALRRMRDRIQKGLPLVLDDSDEWGNKYTHCSWGMCSGDTEQWPDKDDHTFPASFTKSNRITPRECGSCPVDLRTVPGQPSTADGCFYTCRIFQNRRARPNRETVLRWYNDMISKLEAEQGILTAADDNEPWGNT